MGGGQGYTVTIYCIQSIKYGLNILKFVGLDFDGCSTTSGKVNGLQSII